MTIAGYLWKLLTKSAVRLWTPQLLYEREFPSIIRKLKKINSLKFAVNSLQFTFNNNSPLADTKGLCYKLLLSDKTDGLSKISC